MAKGATSKRKREDENRREENRKREETRQRQQRTQQEPERGPQRDNTANSRQTTRTREVAPQAIPVLEEPSTPRRSATGRNVAQMFPEAQAPRTTSIPVVEPQTNKEGQGFRNDIEQRMHDYYNYGTPLAGNDQGIRRDAEERIKASDASQYGAEREETTSMPIGTDMAEKGRKMAERPARQQDESAPEQHNELQDDIAKLAQINTGSALGVSANSDYYARGVLGDNEETKGMGLKDYYAYLQNKYDLTADELDDLALTYKSQLNNEQAAKMSQKAQEFGEEHPALGSIASLPMTLANAVEGVNNVLVGGITGDERRLSNMASGTKQGFREGAKENIDSNGWKVAYDLMMGLGDLGVGVTTGQAPAILAGNTANEATLSAADRGQGTRKAALYGAGSGVLDYITNTIGLDKAKALGMSNVITNGIRGFLKRAGIAAATEAGENLIQDLGQTFLDEVINGNKSEIRTALTQRIQNGESAEQAAKETLVDWLKDRGMSLATGAVMGAGMFGGTALTNNIRNSIPKLETRSLDPAIRELSDPNVTRTHTPEEINEMINYVTSVDNNIVDLEKKVRNGEHIKPYKVSTVNDRMAKDIKRITGLDTAGRDIYLSESSFKHVDKKHGSNGSRDHSMADDESLSRIAYILENYDEAFAPDPSDPVSSQLNTSDNKLAPKVVFTKKIDGHYYVVEAVSDSKSNSNIIISGYIGNLDSIENNLNEGKIVRVADAVDEESSPLLTADTGHESISDSLSDSNINQVDDSVNPDDDGPDIPPDGGVPPTTPPTTPPNGGGGNVPPANGGISAPTDTGIRRSFTNTGVKSGIIDPYDLKNNPVTQRDARYEIHHNKDISEEARRTVEEKPEMYTEQYASGTKEINEDIDLDRAMILLHDDTLSTWTKDSIYRNLAEHGTKAGQFIQAFDKWANTAVGALAKATRVDADTTKKWRSNNRQRVEVNNRVAKAINLIGVPENNAKPIPLTHEQLREQIEKTIKDAFGDEASKFNSDDIEYLTILAETKKIPVRKITQELEHKLETGKWFTIDESLPVKVDKAIKNGQISNMLDRIVNGEMPKTEKEPEAYGRFLGKIRNSLQDEALGLAEEFDDLDVYFIGKMIQERVPKKTIEDELRHRVETGEWYTIDESIQPPKPTNQRLQNAFKQMRGEDTKSERQPKTFEQIRDEVRNTLEKNGELGNYSDSDIEYLSHLVEQGASTNDLAAAMNTKAATGRFGISEETQAKVNELFESARYFNENSRQFVEAQAEALRLLAEEVAPNATPLEKFDTWRYLAMLGNPKTMLRNFVGNKMFSAVTGMSNNLAAAFEHGADYIYNRKTGQHIQRTKEFLNPVKDKALIDGAAKYAEDFAWRQVEGSKYEKLDKDSLRHNRSVFNSELMRVAEQAVDRGISDTNAVIKKFSTSMAGYMKANGIDVSAFDDAREYDALERYSRTHELNDAERAEMERTRPIAAEMDKAREYALKQAEYATFHEDNALAKFLTEQSTRARSSDSGVVRGLGYALEGTIPFKKTPANILKSGFEYSPFGAIKSIAETGKLIYENTGSRKGNLADEYTTKSKISGREKTVQRTLASDVIDSWSKTLTGAGLTALGYYLFNKGILTSSEPGEKYQDQLEGKGNYAININGHTYTLDWAAPGVMPLLIGAEVNKVFKNNGQLDEAWYSNPDQWMQTINGLLDPMLETSMLSGLKDTLQSAANEVRYNEDNALGGILGSTIGNMVTGYATQAIPTLSGQLARTIDPVRRTTDTENEGILGTIEKQGRKVMNKIPFLSMLNAEYRDAYGRGQNNGPFDYSVESLGDLAMVLPKFMGNLAYQTLSPGYYSKMEITPGDVKGREIYNGLDENGMPIKDEKVFADWRSTKKINGEKLDPEQLQTFREEMGQANYGLRNMLAENEWFNSLPATKQNEIFKSLNTIADKIGQYAVMPDSVDVSGELETYLNAGGGEAGIKAIVDNLEYKGLVEGAGTTSNTKVGQAIEDAFNSGDMDRVNYISATSQTLSNYGLKPAAQMAYIDRASELIPGLDADTYGDLFQMIDANGNGEIKQGEIIDALPKLGATDNESALTLYQAFYTDYNDNSKVPEMQSDGTFKAVARKDDTQTTAPEEITNPSVISNTSSTDAIGDAINNRREQKTDEITTLEPQYQPGASISTEDALARIANTGVRTTAASSYWPQAYAVDPTLTPEQFAQDWASIDLDHNGMPKKDEWVTALNNNDLDEAGDRRLIQMYYNTGWNPLKYANGKWSK